MIFWNLVLSGKKKCSAILEFLEMSPLTLCLGLLFGFYLLLVKFW